MSILRVLVADDEALARSRAVRLLAEVGTEVVAVCTNGVEVLSQVAAMRPDMLILDIQMRGLDGFAVATLLGTHRAAIVFCTAHSDHAVPAFELGAVDYVLKPLSRDRLQKSIQKVRAHLLHNEPTASAPPRRAARSHRAFHARRRAFDRTREHQPRGARRRAHAHLCRQP